MSSSMRRLPAPSPPPAAARLATAPRGDLFQERGLLDLLGEDRLEQLHDTALGWGGILDLMLDGHAVATPLLAAHPRQSLQSPATAPLHLLGRGGRPCPWGH